MNSFENMLKSNGYLLEGTTFVRHKDGITYRVKLVNSMVIVFATDSKGIRNNKLAQEELRKLQQWKKPKK